MSELEQQPKSSTILVVDDNPGIRAVIETLLKKEGHNVFLAENGAEALAACNSCDGPLQLLIVDLVLPGSSGGEVAAQISALHPDIRILKISGMMDLSGPTRSANHQFLKKPFTNEELLEKVNGLLSS